jgi:hypothetical protein
VEPLRHITRLGSRSITRDGRPLGDILDIRAQTWRSSTWRWRTATPTDLP